MYKGKVDPESEEGFRRTFDLASVAPPVSPAMGTGATIARLAGQGSNRPLPPLTAGQQAAQTAIDLGAPLPRGLASDSPAVQAITARARQIPWAGQQIGNRAARTVEAAGERIGDIVEELAPTADRAAA